MGTDYWELTRVIDEAFDSLDHSQVSRMPDDQKIAAMKRIRKLADRAAAAAAVVTDMVARSGAADRAAGTPLPDYLALTEGRSPKEGLGQVFQASQVTASPVVRDAALAGQVSPRHAAAIGGELRRMPHDQMSGQQVDAAARQFLAAAPATTPGQLSRQSGRILGEVAPELAPTPGDKAAEAERRRARAVAKRRLAWWHDKEGSVCFAGQLPELEGMRLIPVLTAFAEKGRRAERDVARALMDQRRSGVISTGEYLAARKALETREARTTDQRMADALADMADALAGLGKVPSVGGEPARLVVTLDYQQLREAAQQLADGGLAAAAGNLASAGQLDGEIPIDPGQLRRLCCDAEILPVVLGGDSQILDVGRSARLVTPVLRKALRLRDQGCIFPGCAEPSTVCQAHHVTPWWQGGKTSLDNLVLVCRHHHGVLEPDRFGNRDQWTVEFDPDTHKPRAVPPARMRPHMPSSTPGDQDLGEDSASPRPFGPARPEPVGDRGRTGGGQVGDIPPESSALGRPRLGADAAKAGDDGGLVQDALIA